MNLPYHILTRIIAAALLCLLANAAYVLRSSDQQARQATQRIAEALGKQLSFQQLQISAGFGGALPFPDFTLWKQTSNAPGICVRFVAAGSQQTYRLCNGAELDTLQVPSSFANGYRWFFQPGLALTQSIRFKGRDYGELTVTPSADMEITQAWEDTSRLLGLSITTVAAVCCLVYLGIRRALHPVQTIVAGLGQLEQGRLDYRLPRFALDEWQRIAEAVNQLAASQQQLLNERQRLAVQLLNLQEEERRYLARELHDEFGQCLAASNALAASIAQTAATKCPGLLAEIGQISRITQHILDGVRGLLQRLRPAELEDLGLAASLASLVSGWNALGGKTRYHLEINGDCAGLPEPLAITLFRISQECLTNIAKHADASHARVGLAVSGDSVALTIEDDGIASQLPFSQNKGIGLLGIRERVMALDGRLTLRIVPPHGLKVEARLPIHAVNEAKI
ncbi:MAG: histidine kinase [Methylovulum sp.]|uniref:sensor histidine kinase n=1 Tax=Methylovulum sp. TaxID=1916980 RepID=UPI002629CB2A|nr:histidine kinase [Methylovulum sp.]MDD2722913.1 histidine kinase [Methylovulum sp.]MDD5125878.1 histidine kinase [Methylovulum sp.]